MAAASTAGAAANISNVRILGTTATQAIVAYTAPDQGACTFEVSQSASYSPLIPDVDASLFPEANSDGRSGSISNGLTRVFVVGSRTVQRDLKGGATSRALQAATVHYFRITCNGGAVAPGTFTTDTIRSGSGYGDQIPLDPANPGSYLYPTISETDRTAAFVEPHTGALVKNMTLPNDVTGGGTADLTPSGTDTSCSPLPVAASNGKIGYHCQIMLNNLPALYWLASDGETRFLGVMSSNYVAPGWNASIYAKNAPFDNVDANVFYMVAGGNDPSHGASGLTILKASYNGHKTPGQDTDLTNQPLSSLAGMPHTTYTQLIPWPRELSTLLKEFDPKYVTYGVACCDILKYINGGWSNGKFYFFSWGNQDSFGWVAGFDPNRTASQQIAQFGSSSGCIDNPAVTGSTYSGQKGCIFASTGSFTGGAGSGLRWGVLHNAPALPASPLVPIILNSLRLKTTLAYQVTLSNGLSNSGSTCSMAQPAGNSVTNWPDATWTGGCSTFTVTGEPQLSGTLATMPASLPALPGDLLSIDSSTFFNHEVIRLLSKGSDGKTWYVQRRAIYLTQPYSSVTSGGKLDMLMPFISPAGGSGSIVWWAAESGGLSTDNTNTFLEVLPPNHTSYVNHPVFGRWTVGTGAMQGMEPARLINSTPVIPLGGYPSFNGMGTLAWEALEGHPSLPFLNPPDQETYNQYVDNHPYWGQSNFVTASTVSPVSGQLYRIRGVNVSETYKQVPYFANSGARAMKEVSGPSIRLATDASTQFQWCVALRAEECYAGSLAGDIYFNAPDIVNQYCTNNWTTLQTTLTIPNDICIGVLVSAVQGIKIEQITSDASGQQVRVISNALGKYDQQTQFWNSKAVPDGSWLFTTLPMDSTIKLFKIPPRKVDNVNRAAYVPLEIKVSGGAGANNAVIQFGYGENGPASQFYCTARQEACVATSHTLNSANPFYFAATEAGSISGVPCQGGCSITIPAVPDRVVYYRVQLRDSVGNVLRQEPIQAIATR